MPKSLCFSEQKTLRAIIIDDEKESREGLRLAIDQFCPNIVLVASCGDPEEGIAAIRKYQPDLVFLDVKMPLMSGFHLLDRIGERNFQVVFVTAFDKTEYFRRAIQFSALDYLLKPIDIDDLQAAVLRAEEKMKTLPLDPGLNLVSENLRFGKEGIDKLAIPAHDAITFVDIPNIVYCAADKNYTDIHLKSGEKLTASRTLARFEEMLDSHCFSRVHHSFLINLREMDKYKRGEGGSVIMKNGDEILVSRRRKEAFLKKLIECGINF